MRLPITTLAAISLLNSIQAQIPSISGTYRNANGQTMLIKNVRDESFDFSVTWGENDEWGCLFQVEGTAMFKDSSEAFYGEDPDSPEIVFTIGVGQIQIEGAADHIGMDCAKYGDSQTSGYTRFTLDRNLSVDPVHAEDDVPVIRAEAPTAKYKDWGTRPEESEDGPSDPWVWPNWYCSGPTEDAVRASSTLPAQGKASYGVAHLCDDDPTTAWVEGISADGIGEYVEISDWELPVDGGISILNGYQSSRTSWENNGRVKRLQVSFRGEPVCILELADVMGVQTFRLPDEVYQAMEGRQHTVHSNAEVPAGVPAINDGNGNITYWTDKGGILRFTILEVYPGLKWKDTAISGIFSCSE